jgi:hypothetical protein
MTSHGNGQRRVYQVNLSEQTRAKVKQLYLRVAQAGKGNEFLESLRHIDERLRHDPLDFGEPLFRLPALKLVVYQAAAGRLVVDFAVHEEKPLVFIRTFRLLS